jgi:hypothetical protein
VVCAGGVSSKRDSSLLVFRPLLSSGLKDLMLPIFVYV